MNKTLAFSLIIFFFFIGLMIHHYFHKDKNPVIRFYPYLIWGLDASLLICTLML